MQTIPLNYSYFLFQTCGSEISNLTGLKGYLRIFKFQPVLDKKSYDLQRQNDLAKFEEK